MISQRLMTIDSKPLMTGSLDYTSNVKNQFFMKCYDSITQFKHLFASRMSWVSVMTSHQHGLRCLNQLRTADLIIYFALVDECLDRRLPPSVVRTCFEAPTQTNRHTRSNESLDDGNKAKTKKNASSLKLARHSTLEEEYFPI